MPGAPDELMAIAICENAPEEEFIPESFRGEPVVIVAGCWCGPLDEADRATQPLRRIAEPVTDLSGPNRMVLIIRAYGRSWPDTTRRMSLIKI